MSVCLCSYAKLTPNVCVFVCHHFLQVRAVVLRAVSTDAHGGVRSAGHIAQLITRLLSAAQVGGVAREHSTAKLNRDMGVASALRFCFGLLFRIADGQPAMRAKKWAVFGPTLERDEVVQAFAEPETLSRETRRVFSFWCARAVLAVWSAPPSSSSLVSSADAAAATGNSAATAARNISESESVDGMESTCDAVVVRYTAAALQAARTAAQRVSQPRKSHESRDSSDSVDVDSALESAHDSSVQDESACGVAFDSLRILHRICLGDPLSTSDSSDSSGSSVSTDIEALREELFALPRSVDLSPSSFFFLSESGPLIASMHSYHPLFAPRCHLVLFGSCQSVSMS
jgi:hypothetical protein